MTRSALRRYRKRLKLTQVEMAKKIGVHSYSVARMKIKDMTISEPVARLVRFIASAMSKKKR